MESELARAPAEDSTPAPVAIGTDTYYLDRLADFERRHSDLAPPPYYEELGDKCLRQFRLVEPHLSEHGQAWLERTLKRLQEMMEDRRQSNPREFAALELDGDAFHEFASSTHSAAYLESGLFELLATDLWKILRTPDASDLLTVDGMTEIAKVLRQLDSADVVEIATATLGDPAHEKK